MRYTIKDGKVIESFWIDAPYDTREDAQEALDEMNNLMDSHRLLPH